MIRAPLIDLNPVELDYYPFIISLDKCSARFISVNHLSTKVCTASKTKDINDKVFNMIINENKAKTVAKYTALILNVNSDVQLPI